MKDIMERRTPRQSSMRLNQKSNTGLQGHVRTVTDGEGAFLTQPNDLMSLNANLPKPSNTGATAHRPNKSLVLHQPRYNSFAPDDQLAFEVQREKSKISRFLLIKENQSKSMANREKLIEQRNKVAEKRSMEYEKRKKGDEKLRYQDILSNQREADIKRKRVADEWEQKDVSAFRSYKDAVMKKYKNVDAERKNYLNLVKHNAREEMRRLSLQKERRQSAALEISRNAERETLATLEEVETKVQSGFVKGEAVKQRTKERLMSLGEKTAM